MTETTSAYEDAVQKQHRELREKAAMFDELLAIVTRRRPKPESAWLVELKASTPCWWSYSVQGSEDAEDWITDSLKAIRFARRQDAESVIAYYGWTEAFSSEHQWGP